LWEDEVGGILPTEAGALIEALKARRPRFVFLSACLTAAASERRDAWRGDKQAEDKPQGSVAVAQSLAEALVDGGIPAVLGRGGNYRIYGLEHLGRLSFIRRARDLGFSIEQVRELLSLTDQQSRSCARVDAIARHNTWPKLNERLLTLMACAANSARSLISAGAM